MKLPIWANVWKWLLNWFEIESRELLTLDKPDSLTIFTIWRLMEINRKLELVSKWSTNIQLLSGYNDILLIPAGATNIDIKEVSPSNNYLAIRNLTGHYYLNGNWRIDFPRPLTFGGAIWHYDRRPQGFAAPDHITCIGPTQEPVYLVLLYQDRNVGINYEYSVPEQSALLAEPDSYSWTFTPFGPCSSTCGGGSQTRSISCNSRSTLETVDDKLCDSTLKPGDSQKCGQEECAPQWVEGEWEKCSAPCGNNGTQNREVKCEQVISNG